MREASLVAFNLLFNGIGSFAIGALVALAAARLFRASPGRASVWLWSLPFAKLVLDAAHGIPDGSFLWLRARGVSQDLGSFQIGVGIERVVPKIHLALGALSGGVTYSQSGADLIASGLAKHVGDWAPGAIVVLLVGGAVYGLARTMREAKRASTARARIESRPAIAIGLAGRRRVPIHVVPDLDALSGCSGPFTGGVFRPYVAFPARLWDALGPGEREAAILHELSHVSELHVPWMIGAGVLRDLFWFVPFMGRVHARLAAACEVAADTLAVARGADPVQLASALVRTREHGEAAPSHTLVLGAARGSLVGRVERLLRVDGAAPRHARLRVVARALFVAWAAAIVVIALPFGNH